METLQLDFDPKEVKILLVDDSPLNLKLLEHTLKQKEFDTYLANNGQEAIEKADEIDFDLVLLDIMMPGIDGYCVLEKLRSNEKYYDVPVIFLTALNDSNAKVRGLEAGANDFITKPFNASELIARVNTQLRLRFLNERIKRQHKEIKEKHQVVLKDLESAQRIQNSLLPCKYPEAPRLSFTAQYVPCAQVGGDFYDVFRIDEDNIGIYICDVSGHGVPAAMITVFIKQNINSFLNSTSSPDRLSPLKTMQSLNNSFCHENFGEYYATIFYGVINDKTLEMEYTCAAHNGWPYIINDKGEQRTIGHNSLAIGWFKDCEYPQEKVQLKSGERLVFYTDGIFEALNQKDVPWGSENFKEFTLKYRASTAKDYCDDLLKTIIGYTGMTEQDDDIAILVVDIS